MSELSSTYSLPPQGRLGPRTLAEICLDKALQNSHLITGLGTMAPQYIQRLVKSAPSAAFLHKWELNSDDIYDETEEQWLRLIQKSFSRLMIEHDFVPKHRKSWHKVYDLYKKLNDEKIAADTQKMIQDIAARDEMKQSRQVTVVPGEKYSNLQPHRSKSGWGPPPAKESQSFIAKTRKTLRLEAPRFKIITPAGTLASSASQIKRVPESVRNAHRIAIQPGVLDVNGRRALELERAAQANPQKALRREESEERARLAAPRAKAKANPGYTIIGNVISFDDDEDVDKPAEEDEVDYDDLFGDHLSRDFSPDTIKRTEKSAPKPSAKRARDSTDAAALDRPAKRFQSPSEEPQSTPQVTKPCLPMPTPATPASAPKTAAPASAPKPVLPVPPRRRPKGLSAAPGANSAESICLRRQLLKAPAKRKPTTTATSSSSSGSSPSITSHPASSLPTPAPRTPPHHPTEPVEGEAELEEGLASAEKRRLRHKDGTVTPDRNDLTRRTPLYFDNVPARRIRVLRQPPKLRDH
ncbi:hypothetical protein C8A05DRAFT_11581 [Staphylotrichum tortipilum]|uniref:Elongin-A n=1 Tax=Staphylotrichum tortipilum TaxID=2831512 RepID=A0AAN6MW31_9PEZI|nr:hypothetical protein C8A05DRAFT_11581 [Staphylotrichum longicolle]